MDKVKGIKVSAGERVKLITLIRFGTIPEGEIKVLQAVLDFSNNNNLAISGGIGKQIKHSTGISDTVFSTGLFRLQKRGIITKKGKTIMLHPCYKDINELSRFIIQFEPAE